MRESLLLKYIKIKIKYPEIFYLMSFLKVHLFVKIPKQCFLILNSSDWLVFFLQASRHTHFYLKQ